MKIKKSVHKNQFYINHASHLKLERQKLVFEGKYKRDMGLDLDNRIYHNYFRIIGYLEDSHFNLCNLIKQINIYQRF